MSAQPNAPMQMRPMTVRDLNAVLAIENRAYSFPWTRGNFVDSLAAGYHTLVLADAAVGIVGYFVAMAGVDEMHLLNLTVAPAWQGQGLGSRLLDALEDQCRRLALAAIWLEVRGSNERARALYRQRGFGEVGLRRGYYPAPQGREDAIVMSRRLMAETDGVD
jgi:[ribosomal protein S18]-alanine N-acetyltransferase